MTSSDGSAEALAGALPGSLGEERIGFTGPIREALAALHGKGAADWTRAHEALKAHEDLWASLAFDGIQSDGRGGLIELRRCPACQSTIARPIAVSDALALMCRLARIYAESLASLQGA